MLPKAVAEKTNVFWLIRKAEFFLSKTALWLKHYKHGLIRWTYLACVIKDECEELDLPKSKCLLSNDFTSKSFDCSEENGPKCLNFPNVLFKNQCDLSHIELSSKFIKFQRKFDVLFLLRRRHFPCGEDGYESKTCFGGPACPTEVLSMSSKLLHCAQ